VFENIFKQRADESLSKYLFHINTDEFGSESRFRLIIDFLLLFLLFELIDV